MRVEDLREGEHANQLVERVSSMYEFMACETIDSGHVAPDEGKDKPVEEGVAMTILEYECISCAFEGIDFTDYAKAPQPIK